jgi:hypothetical protein
LLFIDTSLFPGKFSQVPGRTFLDQGSSRRGRIPAIVQKAGQTGIVATVSIINDVRGRWQGLLGPMRSITTTASGVGQVFNLSGESANPKGLASSWIFGKAKQGKAFLRVK